MMKLSTKETVQALGFTLASFSSLYLLANYGVLGNFCDVYNPSNSTWETRESCNERGSRMLFLLILPIGLMSYLASAATRIYGILRDVDNDAKGITPSEIPNETVTEHSSW